MNTLLSILMVHELAAHERLSNLLRRRASGLVSQSVAEAEDGLARVTLVFRPAPAEVEPLRRHIEKMVDVVEATILERDRCVEATMAILRIAASGDARTRATEALLRHGGRVLKADDAHVVGLLSDLCERVERAVEELSGLGHTTVMRTGQVAIAA